MPTKGREAVSQIVTPSLTNWDLYRKCSQVCRAEIGEPCFSLSGRIAEGRPDGLRTPLDAPHVTRKLRTRRAAK